MRRFIAIAVALAAVGATAPAAQAAAPHLSKTRAWSETFDLAQYVGDGLDDGDWESVIPVVEDGNGPSACSRVRRDAVDCDYTVSFFPWSFDDRDPMQCSSRVRVRRMRSGAIRTFSARQPRCSSLFT